MKIKTQNTNAILSKSNEPMTFCCRLFTVSIINYVEKLEEATANKKSGAHYVLFKMKIGIVSAVRRFFATF